MVSISSEASATDNIPTLVTSLATITHRAEQLLAGGGAPAVPKQKYFDDRDGRKEKTVNNKETAGERKTGWPTFEQKTLYKYPDIYRCYIELISSEYVGKCRLYFCPPYVRERMNVEKQYPCLRKRESIFLYTGCFFFFGFSQGAVNQLF